MCLELTLSEFARGEGRRVRFEIGREGRRRMIEWRHHRAGRRCHLIAFVFTAPSLASDHFRFLDDKATLSIDLRLRVRRVHLPDWFPEFVAVAFILVVNSDWELLSHVAGKFVLVGKAARDAEVERLFRLFLAGALFEP